MQDDEAQCEHPTDQELEYPITGDSSEVSNRQQAEDLEEQLNTDHDNLVGGDDDDYADDEEAQGSDLKEIFLFTKSLITRTPYTNKTRRKNTSKSPVWNFFQICNIREESLWDDLQQKDSHAYDKLKAVILTDECYLICSVCYDDPECPLHKALTKPSLKNGSISGTGNMSGHLKKKHPYIWTEARTNKDFVYLNPFTTVPPTPTTQPTASVAGSASQKSTVDTSDYKTPPGGKPPKHVDVHSLAKSTGEKRALETFHTLVHEFATNNGISERAVTRHKECPEFKRMIQFAIDHSKQLSGKSSLFPGRGRFQSIRKENFETLLAAVSSIVTNAREPWKKVVGHRIPFVVIGQDVWESNKKDVLGVTAFIYDPVSWHYEMIPIGLALAESKKSDALYRQILSILDACGIEQCDLYKPTNDTTNASVKIGYLLTGENGTCAMHTTSLLLNHAVGRLTRKSSGKIIDSFDEAEAIRDKAMACATWLHNKKAKSRYLKFVTMMQGAGRHAKKILIPNSTRAAGLVLMYGSLLEARWNLSEYIHRNKDAKELHDDDFWKMSQLHGVLYPLKVLIKQLQTDRFGAISYTYYFIMRTLAMYVSKKKWWVVETRRKQTRDVENQWDGTAAWPRTDYGFTPLNFDKERNEVLGSMNTIGLVCLKKTQLNKNLAQKLIQRIIKEFLEYGAVATNNVLLALSCNPFAATILMSDLETAGYVCEVEGPDDETKTLLKDIKARTKKTLVDEIHKVWGKDLHPLVNASGATDTENAACDDNEDDDEDIYEKTRRKKLKTCHNPNRSSDPVEAEVDDFFSQSFNPLLVLSSQQNKVPNAREVIGIGAAEWLKSVEVIAKHLNLAEWWEGTGKTQFPLIYPIACCILSLPDSNGHQERTFSAATWMDGKLNSMQNDVTFQMKVLCYKNHDFLQRFKGRFEKEQLIVVENKTKALLEQHIGSKKEEEIDSDMDDLMIAYNIEDVRGEDE